MAYPTRHHDDRAFQLNDVINEISLSSRRRSKMKSHFRGSGFRHTLPAVFKFSALWVVVVVVMAPVITVVMMLSGTVPPALHGEVWFFLLTRVPIIASVAIGLAIFTTTRVAGPMVHMKRVCEDIKGGDMDRRLSFRQSDDHLRGLETAFNEMMVVLSERQHSVELSEVADELVGLAEESETD